MSEPTPTPPAAPPPSQDWRTLRAQEREQRRSARAWARADRRAERGYSGAWIGGAILVLLGLVLFARNLGLPFGTNWWAVFLLIPALGSLGSAWYMFQNNGGLLNAAVRGAVLGGIIFAVAAALFLFNIDLGIWWPLLLVGAGVLLLINALLPG